jgi:hypothetical protein
LAFIQANFGAIVTCIKRLEAQGLTINESALILHEVYQAVKDTPGECGDVLQTKIRNVLDNNPDFGTISKIGKILDGENVPNFDMSPDIIAHYKYAPLTSCDVERSFSMYKNILSDNRSRFLSENLEMHLICACESNQC